MDKLILNIEKRPALEMIFRDLEHTEGCELITSKYTFDKGVFRFLYKLHHSRRINKIISLPFKRVWDRFCPLLKKKFPEVDEYYIAFLEIAALQYTAEELERLKSHDNVHLILILFNPLSTLTQKGSPFCRMIEDVDFEKKFAIFDEKDIERIDYHRLTAIYSEASNAQLHSSYDDSDFFYMGMAKDRQTQIQNMYKRIIKCGKKADFTIVYPDPNVKKIEGINYVDHFIDYQEYLKHLYKTKCIVEFLQGEQHGMTLRTFESRVYGKHLLTNNEFVQESPLYLSSLMHFAEDFNAIDFDTIDLHLGNKSYSGEYSPKNLLSQIMEAYE